MPDWTYNDGGRAATGRKGTAADCVVRAVAIATGRPYAEVYDEVAALVAKATGTKSARNGVPKAVRRQYLAAMGWRWVPTMGIGTGCRVHLRGDELPGGRIIASTSKHLVAVIDGVVQDTHDSTRGGKRCVYGYYTKA